MAGPWEKFQSAEVAPVVADADASGPWAKFVPKEETTIMQDVGQGLGNAAAGAVRGAGSIGATLLYPYDKAMDLIKGDRDPSITGLVTGKQPLSRNQERRMQMDQGLKEMGADPESWMYKGGKIGAEVAGTMGVGGALGNAALRLAPGAPALSNAIASGGFNLGQAGNAGAGFLPWLQNMGTRMAGGAITGGASSALIDPSQAGTGAAIGAALPPGVQAVAKAGGALGSAVKNTFAVAPKNRALAEKAINEYGIPLGVADITSSPVVKATRSVLNDTPFIGRIGDAQRDAVQEGFNKAVGSTFGAPEAKLTADVMDAARKRMGAEFDRIWNNNNLQVSPDMINKMLELERQAAKLPKSDGQSLIAELRDLYGRMKPDASGAAIIDGQTANNFQQYLRRRADSSAGLKNELSDLRQNIISSFNKSVTPEEAAALTLNRGQYKAFKTVEPLLNKGETGVAGRSAGDVPAALLPQEVSKSYSRAAGTPLADLSQIGSQFIVDRVARTGGGVRAAIQNGALGIGAASNPVAAAVALPFAALTNKALGNPQLAKSLVRDASADPARYAGLLQMFAQQQPVMAQGLLGSFSGQ